MNRNGLCGLEVYVRKWLKNCYMSCFYKWVGYIKHIDRNDIFQILIHHLNN